MASNITEVKPVTREVTIQDMDCYVTISPDGVQITRKGDKHQKDKRMLVLSWDELMEYSSPNLEIDQETYTPLAYLKYEI